MIREQSLDVIVERDRVSVALGTDQGAHVRQAFAITSQDPNVTKQVISILVQDDQKIRVLKIAGELDGASCALVTRCASQVDREPSW